MPVVTFVLDNNKKCSGIIRGIKVDTIEGRVQGLNIDFNTYNYNDLQMRRKANILQYKNTDTLVFTKSQRYAYQAQNKSSYSQARIQQLIALRATNEEECPIIKTPASNSGIRGDYKTLLFNNNNVPLLLK